MRRGSGGFALLEAVIALAILATAGLALAETAGANTRAVRLAAEREQELLRAEVLLATHALMGRVDLDRRLGQAEYDSAVVSVQRPERGLYRIAVSSVALPDVEQLVTVVFRPDTALMPGGLRAP